MQPLAENDAARDWVGYFEDWEHYAQKFFESQGALQRSQAELKAGNLELARQEIQEAAPQSVIAQYARTIHHGQTSPGEKGVLITLNLRWLPHVEAQRQAVGLDPLQVEFAPTHDEPLAQGVGHYSFDFDVSKNVIAVLGSTELGLAPPNAVKQFPAGAACPSGIDLRTPVALDLGGLAGARLQPGTYRMKLSLPEGVEVQVESGAHRQTATSATEVLLTASDGEVQFTLSPISSSAQICGLTLTTQPESQ
jgi:hypothetical protein